MTRWLNDGHTNDALNLAVRPPAVVMLVGLQGAGKNNHSGQVGAVVKAARSRQVLVGSTDVYRPAAMEQLARLAEEAEWLVSRAKGKSR
ncbi:MAG: hypothetical protein CM1200mP41_04820 [Gammaproteobacteria bacterium]|nr:MAG: hypothetical protein CM1200mP41_04820 [Gammaproteobacteria bacterium]